MAFNVLDKDGSGMVDPEDMVNVYDASKHPAVLAGKRTADDVLREFLDTFDVGGVKDGKVTKEEFENYYANVGANVDDDDYFELMIRNAWHISGGSGWSANSANRRVLVTRADGSEAVEEIKNDLGLKAGDKAGMVSRLKAQGVDATSLSLYGSAGDDNNSGFRSGANSLSDARRQGAGEASSLAKIASKTGKTVADPAEASIALAGPSAGGSKPPAPLPLNVPPGLQHIILKLKGEMKSRGASGFIGLQRKFKIMDDDNSKSLNLAEFKKAMKEMNLNLSDAELRMLFDHFDADRSGSIDFEEFIQGVRDPLTERRLRLVQQAFAKIDKDGSGIVDAEEIASTYDASKHPEVLAGRMTPQQVLNQFLDTFDVGGVKDGMVTQQEFINYYTNLGANIDNDDYFELMIRNAWHISGGSGWSANSANRRVLVTHSDGSQSVQEIKDDLGLKADDKAGMVSRLKAQGVDVASLSLHDSAGDEAKPFNPAARGVPSSALTPSLPAGSRPSTAPVAVAGRVTAKKAAPSNNYGVTQLLVRLKAEMKSRGANGFIGLQRKFRIMDDDNSKALNMAEFKKAMKEMKIEMTDAELRAMFEHFDADGNGSINFEEFIQGVRDPLTARRLDLVKQAFAKIDKDGNGIVEAAEIASKYDASKHPEVLAGRMTPEQVLNQFLDTFDVGGVKDGMVTQQEFINYYTNLGANIDNDDYFELMIRNAWHISGGSGWSANSANRRVLVTHSDGSQSVQEIKDDLGLKADDVPGMIARLRAQNTNASHISIFGSTDVDSGKQVRPQTAPQRLSIATHASAANAQERKSGNATFRSSFSLAFDETSGSKPVATAVVSEAPKKVANLKAVVASQPLAAAPTKAAGGRSLSDIMAGGNASAAAPIHDARVADLMDRLRTNLVGRGAAGIIGIQRKFRIIDDDNSKTLNVAEFTKAMRETGLNFSPDEILSLFKYFDADRSGSIDFEEFLQKLRVRSLHRRHLLHVHLTHRSMCSVGTDESASAPADFHGLQRARQGRQRRDRPRGPHQRLRHLQAPRCARRQAHEGRCPARVPRHLRRRRSQGRQGHEGRVRELLRQRLGQHRQRRLLRVDDPQRVAHLGRVGVVGEQCEPSRVGDAQRRQPERAGDQGRLGSEGRRQGGHGVSAEGAERGRAGRLSLWWTGRYAAAHPRSWLRCASWWSLHRRPHFRWPGRDH
jgi:Ca2+-binding EF-hand superfamily protein